MTLLERIRDAIAPILDDAPEFALPVSIDTPEGATFAVAPGEEGRRQWSGLLFRAGDYGPKGKYGPDDLRRFVSSFPASGVPILDTHQGSFMGRCMDADKARVVKVWTSADGTELHGTKDVPAWLDRAAQGQVKRVSIGLHPDRSGLKEVSLCLNPHVKDAAVFDHDGAALFAASPNFEAFAVAHPDDARIVTDAAKAPVPASPMLTKEQKIEEAKKAHAALPQSMREKVAQAAFVAQFDDAPAGATTNDAEKAQDARLAELEAKFAKSEDDRAKQSDSYAAKAFYEDCLSKGKATPAERERVVATFSDAVELDRLRAERSGVTFSANADGSAEKTLRSEYEAKKPTFSLGGNRIGMGEDLDLTTDFSEKASEKEWEGFSVAGHLGLKEKK